MSRLSPATINEMIHDPKEVSRLAAALDDENWRFRTFLKAYCNWSDGRLNRVAAKLGEEATSQMNCLECGACCRANVVPVTDDEINRLAGRVSLPVLEFRGRYVCRTDEGDQAIDAHPCAFLDGSRCTVYDDRPEPCRGYPYAEGDVRSRMIMILERATVCPIIFEQVERLKDATGFRRLQGRK